jgi:hypothetical protein
MDLNVQPPGLVFWVIIAALVWIVILGWVLS